MTLYQQWKATGTLLEVTRFVKVYACRFGGKTYTIVLTKRFANKHTVLKCEGNHVLWDQIPALFNWGGSMHGEYRPVYQTGREKGGIVLFVVRGRPNGVIGLDDGIFRSADNFDESCVNVMTYKRFKRLCF